jgi:hypothetical protein
LFVPSNIQRGAARRTTAPWPRPPAQLLGELAYRAAQRAITLDITRVMVLDRDSLCAPPTPNGFSFGFLTAQDIRRYADDPASGLSSDLAARIDGQHDLSYAALSGDRLASYIFLALGSIEGEHNRGRQPGSGVAISFAPDVAFVYKGFTAEAFRGQRLYPCCLAGVLDELAPRGIRSLLITTDWTNSAALRACRQIGFCDLGPLWRFGRGKAMFTAPPQRAKLRGIRFDRHANVHYRIDAADASPLQPDR